MKCRICKRTLKNPEAVREGIGPVCKRKLGIFSFKSAPKNEADSDIFEPYNGGNVWIERVAQLSLQFVPGFGTVLQGAKHSASGVKTNVPRQIYKHSPTGYNYGYGGSGPADFALNVCLLFCKHAEDAYGIYQDFKFKFVAAEQSDRLEIQKQEILQFLEERGIEVKL